MKPTFLLVTCSNNKNIEMAKEIQKNYGIDEAVPVFGTYDCIVKTGNMPYNEVKQLILTSIKPLNYVKAVLALYTDPPEISKN